MDAERPDFRGLAAALRGHDGVIETSLDAFVASTTRVPGAVERAALAQQLAPIVEALADALEPSRRPGGPPGVTHLVAGSADLREVERAASLLGAGLAAGAASGFDLAALMRGLRRALGEAAGDPDVSREATAFAEWLGDVALDAFAGARVASERERWREQLEDGTPVVVVAPEVPAAFLIGRPDGRLLDAVFARLLLLAVRVGARTVLIEASGLAGPGEPAVLAALERFVAHPKIVGKVHVVAIGLDPEVEATWLAVGRAKGTRIDAESHFDRAVVAALGVAGYRVLHP